MIEPRKTTVTMQALRRSRSAVGFTLSEILLALGIFAIGMAAVSSLFPVAALLQRETASDIQTNHVASSAEAFIQAYRFTYDATQSGTLTGNLDFYHAGANSTNNDVESLVGINAPTVMIPTAQRAYPSSQLSGNNFGDVSNCDFFWVPFVQDLNGDPFNPNWVIKVFILESDSRVNYNHIGGTIANPSDNSTRFPRVVSIVCSYNSSNPKQLVAGGAIGKVEAGDMVMDNHGTVYTIQQIIGNALVMDTSIATSLGNPTALWLAPRNVSANGSPTREILTISINPGRVTN